MSRYLSLTVGPAHNHPCKHVQHLFTNPSMNLVKYCIMLCLNGTKVSKNSSGDECYWE